MKEKSFAILQLILGLVILCVALTMMGCASGTTKTEAWRFDDETIAAVKAKCKSTFPDAKDGTTGSLWANKRSILSQSRDCAAAAQTLAGQAENRNKVIGND